MTFAGSRKKSENQNDESKQLEMSKYIDLDLYHAVERTHPFYLEMLQEIHNQISIATKKKTDAKLLELGAGTGLLTQELATKHPQLGISALEYDWKIYNLLRKHVGKKVTAICGDAVKYFREGFYDVVVSCFAHDHIHFNSAEEFAFNIRKNLKRGGRYIMGGELLPLFRGEQERIESLYKYHVFIIEKALRDGNFEVAKLEIDALRSGVQSIGDFKRHEAMFEEEMSKGFRLIQKIKVGPNQPTNVGGVFVYVFEAI